MDCFELIDEMFKEFKECSKDWLDKINQPTVEAAKCEIAHQKHMDTRLPHLPGMVTRQFPRKRRHSPLLLSASQNGSSEVNQIVSCSSISRG